MLTDPDAGFRRELFLDINEQFKRIFLNRPGEPPWMVEAGKELNDGTGDAEHEALRKVIDNLRRL